MNSNRLIKKSVVIHFAGDSGDGMQIIGDRLTQTSALLGNDVQTFPDFPAEIRAPQGTLPGVSGFQLHIANSDIKTPGDAYDILVAMNPAALVMHIKHLLKGGILIVDSDRFEASDLKKARLTENPLLDPALENYNMVTLPMTDLVIKAVEPFGLSRSQAKKCRNFFALGIVSWVLDRKLEPTQKWIEERFSKTSDLKNANQTCLQAGYDFAQTCELFQGLYTVEPAPLPSGCYRQITGNGALALGIVALAHQSKRPVVVAGYPITPASEVLHQVAQYPHKGVTTLQAEDEIAAIGAALGAAYGGGIGITCTSGPGMDLKAEMVGLAVMTELPLIIIDVQRAGPSTGMPTKTEQADLLQALYGRHGESPVPVLAPMQPGDAFQTIIEAANIAIRYMTPVFVLSDAYLANGAEPWKIPDVNSIVVAEPAAEPVVPFMPYARCPETLARAWVAPGHKDFRHRIGGLEKESTKGNISYDPDNHQAMVSIRQAKIKKIRDTYPPLTLLGPSNGEVLIIGWGSTWGALHTAVEQLQQKGINISHLQLRHLNPLPKDLEGILKSFQQVLVAELNTGQLCKVLRAEYLVNAQSITQCTGRPFSVEGLVEQIQKHIKRVEHGIY